MTDEIQVYDGDGVGPPATISCMQLVPESSMTWTNSNGRQKFNFTCKFATRADRDRTHVFLKEAAINNRCIERLDVFGPVLNATGPHQKSDDLGVSYRNVTIEDAIKGANSIEVHIEADVVFYQIERARGR